MPALQQTAPHANPALVAKIDVAADKGERYLLLTPLGKPTWTEDPEAATPFASMREATRMAMRLPAAIRAFGLPREPELSLFKTH